MFIKKTALLSLIFSFVLTGCSEDVVLIGADNAKETEYGFYLISQQLKYPTQNEFTVSSQWEILNSNSSMSDYNKKFIEELSKSGKGDQFFDTKLGYMAKNYKEVESGKLLVSFYKRNWSDFSDKAVHTCYFLLKSLDDKGALYGYNLNSSDILERTDPDLKDQKWIEKTCNDFAYNKNVSELSIMMNLSNLSDVYAKPKEKKGKQV